MNPALVILPTLQPSNILLTYAHRPRHPCLVTFFHSYDNTWKQVPKYNEYLFAKPCKSHYLYCLTEPRYIKWWNNNIYRNQGFAPPQLCPSEHCAPGTLRYSQHRNCPRRHVNCEASTTRHSRSLCRNRHIMRVVAHCLSPGEQLKLTGCRALDIHGYVL